MQHQRSHSRGRRPSCSTSAWDCPRDTTRATGPSSNRSARPRSTRAECQVARFRTATASRRDRHRRHGGRLAASARRLLPVGLEQQAGLAGPVSPRSPHLTSMGIQDRLLTIQRPSFRLTPEWNRPQARPGIFKGSDRTGFVPCRRPGQPSTTSANAASWVSVASANRESSLGATPFSAAAVRHRPTAAVIRARRPRQPRQSS